MKPLKILLLLSITVLSLNAAETHAQSNVGTEFYLAFPANWEAATGRKYIQLYISSSVETKVDVYAGGQFLRSVLTVPNDVVTVELSPLEGQIFVRDDQSPVPDDQIYRNKAVRIVAEAPIVVYGMNRTNFSSDGLLALPVSGLGKEYVVSSAASVEGAGQNLPSQYMVIAPYDNTTVTITNPMNTPNHGEGETLTITMNRGDVFSAMSVGNGGDLTGAHILASHPVAVTAGQNCTFLPDSRYPACDHLVEMMTPVTSWGRTYNAVPFINRTKGDTYRILAGEPGAEIFINGTKFTTLTSVGGEQGVGWIEFREEERRPLTFSSNKLIQVVQYNNSQTYDNAAGSDPFYIVLPPVEQYQDKFVFATPPAEDFPQNFINIVGDSAAVADAEIKAAGAGNWRKLSTALPGAGYDFPTAVQGKKYGALTSAITNGMWEVRSSGPLSATLYAGNSFDSYGFPIALLLENRTIIDTVAPVLNKTVDCGGTITATVRDMPDDASSRSNLSTIWIDGNAGSNYRLTVDAFIPGENRTAGFYLEVVDPKRDAYGVIEIRDYSGNVLYDTVEYVAPRLALASPTFDTVHTGTRQEREVVVENQGDRPIRIKQILLNPGSRGFEADLPSTPLILQPSERLIIPVRFSADQPGTYTDMLVIAQDSCPLSWNANLQAVVVDTLSSVRDTERPKNLLDLSIQPNPVPHTADLSLTFTLGSRMPVRIEMFNAAGDRVREPEEMVLEPGENRQTIRVADLPSGVYYLVVKGGGEELVQHCMIVR